MQRTSEPGYQLYSQLGIYKLRSQTDDWEVPMNIVCACDANFIAHLATMLLSFVENNARHKLGSLFFATARPGREKLAAMFNRHRVDLSLISIEENFLQGLFVSYHVARVAYARLLMGELLPPEIDRVIYLDCDLI
jgi:lipopolysaccharide biosynthesis glycosyltransferase